jgi:serine/threonine protein kinase
MSRKSRHLASDKHVDEICDRFEAAWNSGQKPCIEDFLADANQTVQSILLQELIALEVEFRFKENDPPLTRDYVKRFPGNEGLIEAVFEEILGTKPLPTPHVIPPSDESTPKGLQTTNVEIPLPERFGRYKVIRLLGHGTFGNVYLADDAVMGRHVAIKVPTGRFQGSSQAQAEFIREARSVAKLHHEGIVRAYDFGEEYGSCFIVYEYVNGTTLEKRQQQSQLSTKDAVKIIALVAEALHHAHLEGFVHRDIKPANILLDQHGKPRVADFGLAVQEEDLPQQKGALAGTLPYMSPEQIRRETHHIDGRSDIYSLGVVLYELLSGRKPFAGKSHDELKDQILNREAKPLRQIKDSVPPELERICLKALSKRIQDRFSTAKDMAVELDRVARSLGENDFDRFAALSLEDIEQQMGLADEKCLIGILQYLATCHEPVAIPLVFRCLVHPKEPVRKQARKAVHMVGWDKVTATAEEIADQNDTAHVDFLIDGLAAFEADPRIVSLLDRLVVRVKGDRRNRTIRLLEKKRLGLELDKVSRLFRSIKSPYRIEKALGQGVFTAAYLAHTEGADLKVVVRVLRAEYVTQPHFRAVFLDHTMKTLAVVHENVVLTREARAFPEQNTYFAVRDFIEGVTLQELFQKGYEFDRAYIVSILKQVISGLAAVHRRGLWHGGIKPSNIFLGEKGRVVLGDFSLPASGMAMALDRLSYDYRYAAPEHFRDGAKPGPAADFYSLGCVAYEMACGIPPFVSDNYHVLAACHVHETIVPPAQQRAGSRLGSRGDEVVMKLLAREPNDRYANVEEVQKALDEIERVEQLRTGSARPTPPLGDSSLARFQGTESIIGLDVSMVHQSFPGAALDRVRPPRIIIGSADADVDKKSPESLPGDDSAVMSSPAGGSALEGVTDSVATPAPEAVAPAQKPLTQQRLGPYEILEILGKGGMGTVYKARDTRLDRIVALKVLPAIQEDHVQRSQAPLQSIQHRIERVAPRFTREARAVARLSHPAIVQIYEIGGEGDQPYLSLEYVEGGSLAEKLRKKEQFSPRAAVDLVARLARGLQHAHEQGVLHRDLKPSNILMTRDGHPKIADFGLAKMHGSLRDDVAATQAGTILGTPAYMAPEQASGNVEKIGVPADIFGLGAILYELLAGRRPFEGKTVMETLMKLVSETPARPSQFNSFVDQSLDVICLKCLEKEPQNRYASAKSLAIELENWERNRLEQLRPPAAMRSAMGQEPPPLKSKASPGWFRRVMGGWFSKGK